MAHDTLCIMVMIMKNTSERSTVTQDIVQTHTVGITTPLKVQVIRNDDQSLSPVISLVSSVIPIPI